MKSPRWLVFLRYFDDRDIPIAGTTLKNIVAAVHGRGALAVALIAVIGWMAVFHDFNRYAKSAPLFEVDDALVNISLNISENGVFGNYYFPIIGNYMGGETVITARSYTLHGPWYYYVAAAVDWIGGNGLAAQRAVHPLGILFVSVLAWIAFRRHCVAAAALAAFLLIDLFVNRNWPMVRPDIMIPVFGILTVFSAGAAIAGDSPRAWAAAAFFASSAFFSHVIGFSLPPLVFLLWLIWLVDGRRGRAGAGWHLDPVERKTLIGLFAGVGIAVVAFIAMFGTDIPTQLDVWSRAVTRAASQKPYNLQGDVTYWAMVGKHILFFWSGNLLVKAGMLVAYLAAGGLLLAGLTVAKRHRRAVLALLLPPLVVGVGFMLSLGLFVNTHSGYALLPQVMPLWLAGASLCVIAIMLRHWGPTTGLLADGAAGVLACVLLLTQAKNVAVDGSHWNALAVKSVAADAYAEHMVADLPPGARIWGPLFLSMLPPSRFEMVSIAYGPYLFSTLTDELKRATVPDALVINHREFAHSLIARISRGTAVGRKISADYGYTHAMMKFFEREYGGDEGYFPVRLTVAPPYGTTTTFFRMRKGTEPTFPTVAFNDGRSPQWNARLGDPLAVQFRGAKPVAVAIPPNKNFEGNADRSQVADLPKGRYLIAMRPIAPAPGALGVLFVTRSDRQVIGTLGGGGWREDYGIPEHAYYFPWHRRVFLFVDHPGGKLIVSQMDTNPGASFEVTGVHPIPVLDFASRSDRLAVRPLPVLTKWTAASADVKIVSAHDQRLEVITDRSQYKYQVESPPIPVTPGSKIVVKMSGEVLAGAATFGVLSQSGRKWLAQAASLDEELVVRVGDSRTVRVVIYNLYLHGPPAEPGRFVIGPGTLQVLPAAGAAYADTLLSCLQGRRTGDRSKCADQR